MFTVQMAGKINQFIDKKAGTAENEQVGRYVDTGSFRINWQRCKGMAL